MMLQLVLMVILVLLMVNHCLGQRSSEATVRPSRPLAHAPVAGRTCQPDCPACQAEVGQVQVTPPPRPAPRQKKKAGRPRHVQTDWHFCPHRGCTHYGWVGLGNIVANGHPNGGAVSATALHGMRPVFCREYRDDPRRTSQPAGPRGVEPGHQGFSRRG